MTENKPQEQKSVADAKDVLSDDQLDEVAGGTITKTTDQSSPTFFNNTVAGPHYTTGTTSTSGST